MAIGIPAPDLAPICPSHSHEDRDVILATRTSRTTPGAAGARREREGIRVRRHQRLRLQAVARPVLPGRTFPARRWLEYASRRFNSIELNGTFYSLKSPAVFERWVSETPERDFVFAVKGGRFITHNLKLRRPSGARQLLRERRARARQEARARSSGSFPRTYSLRRRAAGRLHATCCRARARGGGGRAAARSIDCDAARSSTRRRMCRIATRSRFATRATSTRSSTRSCGASLRLRHRRHGGQVSVRRGGDGRLRVRAAARIAGALRERLHRRGARRVGGEDRGVAVARGRAATCTSTSTTTRRSTRRSTRND